MTAAGFKYIGKSLPKTEAMDKVLGAAKYTEDMEFPGMLHAKLLRSKFPHARVLNINIGRAEKLFGVHGAITAKDIPVNAFGYNFKDQVVFADGTPTKAAVGVC